MNIIFKRLSVIFRKVFEIVVKESAFNVSSARKDLA